MTDQAKPEPIKPHGFLALAAVLFIASIGFFGWAVVAEPQFKDPASWATGMTFLGSLASWIKAASKTTGQRVEENTSAVLTALNTQNQLNEALRTELKSLHTKLDAALEKMEHMDQVIASLQTAEEESDTEFADVLGVLDNHGAHIVKIQEHLKAADPAFEPGLVQQRDLSKSKKR